MRKLIAPAILALSLVLAPVATAPAAQAYNPPCTPTSDPNWPFCHIGRPSIPRIDVDGPRPPLTPKSSAWCWAQFVATEKDDVVWSLLDNTKIPIRFWPDYYHRTYHLLAWSWKDGVWYTYAEHLTVDCDA